MPNRNMYYCPHCDGKRFYSAGYKYPEFIDGYENCDRNTGICKTCGRPAEPTNIDYRDFLSIQYATNGNRKILDAMRKLSEEDIIEYELKLAQFKKISEEKRRISCPRCGSSMIATGARGANGLFGFFGASKTVNRCSSCGYTWEPKG